MVSAEARLAPEEHLEFVASTGLFNSRLFVALVGSDGAEAELLEQFVVGGNGSDVEVLRRSSNRTARSSSAATTIRCGRPSRSRRSTGGCP
jgi:hypothetical protein